jgi:UDP-glucose 4-epimerase
LNIVVFGGTGFLGSALSLELLSRGHQVTLFDKQLKRHLKKGEVFIEGDILDQDQVMRACQGQDVVYNFAGLSDLNRSLTRPVETLSLNVMGNTHVLQGCMESKVSRYLYASTVYVFSDKGSFYGVSKRCSEKIIEEYAREFGLNTTIIRYGSVYGPGADYQNRIYRMIREALETGKITFQGTGEEEREYIHVQDAARLSADLLAKEYEGANVILSGLERFRYRDLLRMIQEILGERIEVDYQGLEYKGHYDFTPYSFNPSPGKKIVLNPYTDFGQGLLQSIEEVYHQLKQEGGSASVFELQ